MKLTDARERDMMLCVCPMTMCYDGPLDCHTVCNRQSDTRSAVPRSLPGRAAGAQLALALAFPSRLDKEARAPPLDPHHVDVRPPMRTFASGGLWLARRRLHLTEAPTAAISKTLPLRHITFVEPRELALNVHQLVPGVSHVLEAIRAVVGDDDRAIVRGAPRVLKVARRHWAHVAAINEPQVARRLESRHDARRVLGQRLHRVATMIGEAPRIESVNKGLRGLRVWLTR